MQVRFHSLTLSSVLILTLANCASCGVDHAEQADANSSDAASLVSDAGTPQDSAGLDDAATPRDGAGPDDAASSQDSAGLDDAANPQDGAGLDDAATPQDAAGLDDAAPPQDGADLDDATTPQDAAGLDDAATPQDAAGLDDAATPQDAAGLYDSATPQDGAGLDDAAQGVDADPGPLYSLGGTVSGLEGSGLVLQNNAGDDLAIAEDGSFSFASALPDDANYAVGILQQPSSPSQECVVTAGQGQIAGSNVETVSITCTTLPFIVSVEINGLLGDGLHVQLNEAEELTANSDGVYSFTREFEDGALYYVEVTAQPGQPLQICEVSHPYGLIEGASPAPVQMDCTTLQFRVLVDVSGHDLQQDISGSGLVVQNNAGDDLAVLDGLHAFTAQDDGSAYAVTVLQDPASPDHVCTVTEGSGNIDSADATIVITCANATYSLGGPVVGLNRFGDEVTLSFCVFPTPIVSCPRPANITLSSPVDSFSLRSRVADGSRYLLWVKTQPSSSTCSLVQPSGRMLGGVAGDLELICAADTYSVGGKINDLPADAVLNLSLNDGQRLRVVGDGNSPLNFGFPDPLPLDFPYEVSVRTHPSGMRCVVGNGSGTVMGLVKNITISCAANSTPTANITVSEYLVNGGVVDGSDSVDPEGDTLFYSWEVVSPEGLEIVSPASIMATVVFDFSDPNKMVQDVTLSLTVSDGVSSHGSIESFKIYRSDVVFVAQGTTGTGRAPNDPMGHINDAIGLAENLGMAQVVLQQGTWLISSDTIGLGPGMALRGGFDAAWTRQRGWYSEIIDTRDGCGMYGLSCTAVSAASSDRLSLIEGLHVVAGDASYNTAISGGLATVRDNWVEARRGSQGGRGLVIGGAAIGNVVIGHNDDNQMSHSFNGIVLVREAPLAANNLIVSSSIGIGGDFTGIALSNGDDPSVVTREALVVGNTIVGPQSGNSFQEHVGVYASGVRGFRLVNNIIDLGGQDKAKCIQMLESSHVAELAHNDLSGCPALYAVGGAFPYEITTLDSPLRVGFLYTNLGDEGNVSAQPIFVDAAATDYHLAATSYDLLVGGACMWQSAADLQAVNVDLEGVVRTPEGSYPGGCSAPTGWSIGAFEYVE